MLNSGIGCSLGSQELGHPLVCSSALLPQPGWWAARLLFLSTFFVSIGRDCSAPLCRSNKSLTETENRLWDFLLAAASQLELFEGRRAVTLGAGLA